jgi:hypothetical protein
MNQVKVQLQINIPAEWLVTNQTNKFIEVHATVMPLTGAVIYNKMITTGLTMFAFNNMMCDKIMNSIDEMCRREADAIESGMDQDQLFYHEIAEHGI